MDSFFKVLIFWRQFTLTNVSKPSYCPKDYLSLPVCDVVRLWLLVLENNIHDTILIQLCGGCASTNGKDFYDYAFETLSILLRDFPLVSWDERRKCRNSYVCALYSHSLAHCKGNL